MHGTLVIGPFLLLVHGTLVIGPFLLLVQRVPGHRTVPTISARDPGVIGLFLLLVVSGLSIEHCVELYVGSPLGTYQALMGM